MNEESLLRRTLLLTGKLVGIFSIWVTLVSLVATFAASRIVGALSGETEKSTLAPNEPTTKAAARVKNPPLNVTNKPNG